MKDWIRAKKAAKIADCSISTIFKHVRKGNIARKKKKYGKGYLYKTADVANLELIGNRNPKNVTKMEKKAKGLLVSDDHCDGCTWKLGKTCMFHRCVRHNGWSANQKEYERMR